MKRDLDKEIEATENKLNELKKKKREIVNSYIPPYIKLPQGVEVKFMSKGDINWNIHSPLQSLRYFHPIELTYPRFKVFIRCSNETDEKFFIGYEILDKDEKEEEEFLKSNRATKWPLTDVCSSMEEFFKGEGKYLNTVKNMNFELIDLDSKWDKDPKSYNEQMYKSLFAFYKSIELMKFLFATHYCDSSDQDLQKIYNCSLVNFGYERTKKK